MSARADDIAIIILTIYSVCLTLFVVWRILTTGRALKRDVGELRGLYNAVLAAVRQSGKLVVVDRRTDKVVVRILPVSEIETLGAVSVIADNEPMTADGE